jgi:hypothetical protein
MANLTEGQKWIISLWTAILFILIASPLMFKLTGSVFQKLGLQTQQGGCPNWWGILIHAVVFALLIRLLMWVPLPGREEYTGLASPASMIKCNTAYLYADQKNCSDCVDAAQTCMNHPFTKECKHAIQKCQNNCQDQRVTSMVSNNCNIYGHVDYTPKGRGC